MHPSNLTLDDSSLEQDSSITLQLMPHMSEVRQVGEDWSGITSTNQRRQLQNRLNQRARRQSPCSILYFKLPRSLTWGILCRGKTAARETTPS